MFWFLYVVAWLPIHIFAPFKIIGRKNIKKKDNYIIACNHLSYYDPLILDYVFRSRNRYLAKQELFTTRKNRFWLGHVFGGIPIDRSKGLTPSQLREVNGALNKRQNMGIFVDGTRREFGEDNNIKGGACYFAIRNKKRIVPCYIAKKHGFFRKNSVLVGSPISFEEYYDKKIDKEVLAKADELLKERMLDLKHTYELNQKQEKIVKAIKNSK